MNDPFTAPPPSFPPNAFGLDRGSVLRCNIAMPHLGLKVGTEFPIGFRNGCVVCGKVGWSIAQIEGEIRSGNFTVTNKQFNLTDPDAIRCFAETVELSIEVS
ncbi:MAG: hypothetical protein PHT12_05400 [Patescibacteria group bacterium]|nr:hypothetical protein [Patescibacteria group bacterium]